MIDIPPGSSPSTSATTTVTPPSVDTVKAAVQAKLEAVVQQVQARHPEGQPDTKSWDILLRLNPQTSGTPVRADTLTPELLRTLQGGQPVLLQTRANLMLPVDTRLHVIASVANGVQIQTMQPPPLPTQTLPHLRQFIHQQQPLAPLLTNLLQLLQPTQQPSLQTLPLRVQIAIANMIAALPDPQAVREQLKTWVENSGLLQEAKLAQQVRQNMVTTPLSNAAQPTTDTAIRTRLDSASSVPVLQQARQQVQAWVQRLKMETLDGKAPAAANPSATTSTASLSPLAAVLAHDIKHQLQRLEQQLQSAGVTLPTTSMDTTAGRTPASATAPMQPATPSPAPTATNTDVIATDTAAARKAPSPELVRSSESLLREATAATSTPIKSPLAIQRYQASLATSATTKVMTDATTPDLIPPLPGQVVVQAQQRARSSLKQDDMADAIVKTLLAQVRGALARVTLHQLSSHSARQDSATPTTLSFEIPFLHNNQIDVFQFRIDDETPREEERKEKNQGKRWVVQMGFDIEGLGPMFCQLSLIGKNLAVQFWAAWEQTLTSTKAHFGLLEQALQGMGIRVEKIQAQLGMPEVDRTGLRNQLVDIKT